MDEFNADKFLKDLLTNLSQNQRETVEKVIEVAENEGIKVTLFSKDEPSPDPLMPLIQKEYREEIHSERKKHNALYKLSNIKNSNPSYQRINLGISIVNRFIKLLSWIILLDVSQKFHMQLIEMQSFFGEEEYSPWKKEIARLIESNKYLVQDLIDGGEVELEKSLQQELMDELMNLQPLEQFYLSDGKTVEIDGALHLLIEGLKEDVKKGNRANFKGLQELEMKFEQFVHQIQADKKEEISKAVQEMKERNDKVKNLALEMFDQLDSAYQAVQQLGNDAVTKQLEKIIEKSLHTLESYGFEEIEVLGKFIDGKTMISLGNVSRQQYAPYLEQYQVYSVHKRGFRDKETKEIIRKATVITVD